MQAQHTDRPDVCCVMCVALVGQRVKLAGTARQHGGIAGPMKSM
jgi:hypothetical protein